MTVSRDHPFYFYEELIAQLSGTDPYSSFRNADQAVILFLLARKYINDPDHKTSGIKPLTLNFNPASYTWELVYNTNKIGPVEEMDQRVIADLSFPEYINYLVVEEHPKTMEMLRKRLGEKNPNPMVVVKGFISDLEGSRASLQKLPKELNGISEIMLTGSLDSIRQYLESFSLKDFKYFEKPMIRCSHYNRDQQAMLDVYKDLHGAGIIVDDTDRSGDFSAMCYGGSWDPRMDPIRWKSAKICAEFYRLLGTFEIDDLFGKKVKFDRDNEFWPFVKMYNGKSDGTYFSSLKNAPALREDDAVRKKLFKFLNKHLNGQK